MSDIREKLRIEEEDLQEINDFLLSRNNPLVNGLLRIVENYGGVERINSKAREACRLDTIMARLEGNHSPFVKDIQWLIEQRDNGAFVNIPEYRRRILEGKAKSVRFNESFAVTLEISACNFFPWLIEEAKKAIAQQDLMPARYIRVRNMKEQVQDDDILALSAAMQIIGASYVQTLDTKGTMPGPDGQPINVHLGGSKTITGYFGGVGVPNRCALKWAEEFLHYYTKYGIRQVLNLNVGTTMLGYWLHKLGIDIEFKVSVFLGNDNPYACLWTLLMAKLFSRDCSTPLIGFNLSNSADNETIELANYVRKAIDFEDIIRIEHHIVETYKGIVRQPYDRLDELLKLAGHVKNISAKHEGGVPDIEKIRQHPSDILEYFLSKKEIIEKGLMSKLLVNYLDKHDAVNRTARLLTEQGKAFIAAWNLHKK